MGGLNTNVKRVKGNELLGGMDFGHAMRKLVQWCRAKGQEISTNLLE